MTGSVVYRRSNLREALLDRALAVLDERGEAALSLRELARDVGVSHTAPARHFADRRELIEALAVEGFHQLEADLRRAIDSQGSVEDQARCVARSYVEFAIQKANLVDVMFRHEAGGDPRAIGASATAAFGPLVELFQRGLRDGVVRSDHDAGSAATLFLATLQGLAALISCGVIEPDGASRLVEDVVPRFFRDGDPSLSAPEDSATA